MYMYVLKHIPWNLTEADTILSTSISFLCLEAAIFTHNYYNYFYSLNNGEYTNLVAMAKTILCVHHYIN